MGKGRGMRRIIFLVVSLSQFVLAYECNDNIRIEVLTESPIKIWRGWDSNGFPIYSSNRYVTDPDSPAGTPYEFNYWRVGGFPECSDTDLCDEEYSRFYVNFVESDEECLFNWAHWGDQVHVDTIHKHISWALYQVLAPTTLVPEIQDSLQLHPKFHSFHYLETDKYRNETGDAYLRMRLLDPPFAVHISLPLFDMTVNELIERFPYLENSMDDLNYEYLGSRDSAWGIYSPVVFYDTTQLKQLFQEPLVTTGVVSIYRPLSILSAQSTSSNYTLHDQQIEVHESGVMSFYSTLGQLIESRRVQRGDFVEVPQGQRYLLKFENR